MSARPVADTAPWRRLARNARRAAETGEAGDVASLAKVEGEARRAVVIGVLSKSNACVRLVRLSRGYVAATVRKRRDLAPELLAAVAQVEALVAVAARATDPDPPPRRLRADIDG